VNFKIVSLFRRPRRNRDGATAQNQDAPAPPPSTDGSSSSIERTDRSPSLTSTHRTHSTPNSSTLLYLQPEYAVCTRSLTECNIHDLIRQPNGVDKNEWVANNSSLIWSNEKKKKQTVVYFSSCGFL